jgi:TonB family protein
VIHFDFEERRPDDLVVGSAISPREGVLWSIVVHAALIVLLAVLPTFELFVPSAQELEQLREARLALERPDDMQFVFMEPLRTAPPPVREQIERSDIDRRAETVAPAPLPENPLPFSRGDTFERVVEAAPEVAPPAPAVEEAVIEAPPPPRLEQQLVRNAPPAPIGGPPRPREDTPRPRAGGVIAEAVRNLSQYTQTQTFENPQGSGEPGSSIDFDSKGVDFGPWLRRFVNQVKRNWFVPLSAASFRGRVVVQFNIHRDGRITDARVVRPSDIPSFTQAAFNAIVASNPTEPLPPEYPDETVLFTVTFFYNEPAR